MAQDPFFFTPPRLKPLGLDVVGIQGGGFAPAQYFGITADDREIYCRYRGGWLSVRIADSPGADAVEGEVLLDEQIGTDFHSTLSLGQLCRYAGITINGSVFPLPKIAEISEDKLIDLSGETTYLECRAEATKASAIDFYNEIASGELGVLGCESLSYESPTFKLCKQGEYAKNWLITLVRRVPLRAAKSWPVDAAHIDGVGTFEVFGSVAHSAFQADSSSLMYHSWAGVSPPPRGSFLYHEEGLGIDTLQFGLSFQTDDESARELACGLHRIFTRRFPSKPLLAYNIETGERVPSQDAINLYPLDSRIASWVAASDFHWIRGSQSNGVYIGYRPEM